MSENEIRPLTTSQREQIENAARLVLYHVGTLGFGEWIGAALAACATSSEPEKGCPDAE